MSRPQNHRNYHQKSYGRRYYIDNGACGIFFTVDGEERRAVKEAMNLLDIFSSSSAASSEKKAFPISEDTGERDDVSDELTKMCESSKVSSDTNYPRFRQLETGVRNTLFFSSTAMRKENIYKLADMIVEDCQQNKRCRFLARILPVEETCAVNIDSITTSLKKIMREHLDSSTEDPSYAVDFKQRNNDMLKRQNVIDLVTTIMAELSPDSKVNLTEPDLVIGVNVVKKVTMLSCLRKYFQLNRFSIRTASEKTEDEEHQKVDYVKRNEESASEKTEHEDYD